MFFQPALRVAAKAASITILVAASAVAGCSPAMAPRALSPTLDAADVERTTGNHVRIMDALAADASYRHADFGWYDVVVAGFNYVDDLCNSYFTGLHRFENSSEAFDRSLGSFERAAAALMGPLGATQLTATLVTQSFGIASALGQIARTRFTNDKDPAATKVFVKKTLDAYRISVAAARDQITSSPVAYGYIQGYLDLCLEVTIEANLSSHIANAVAVAAPSINGSAPQVFIGSNNQALVSPLLANANQAVVAAPLPDRRPGRNPYENQVPTSIWRSVQRALCIPIDGDPGDVTHQAIAQFLDGMGRPAPDVIVRGIGPSEMALLSEAVDLAAGKTCRELEYENAFEVGQSMR
jgi:hypothetical protein